MFIDLIILALLLGSLIHGFRKGLVLQVVVIAGLLLGTWAALAYADQWESLVAGWRAPTSLVPVLSFVLVFGVVMIVVVLIAHLVHHLLHLTPLGLINRCAGAVFGFCTGLFAVSLFIVFLNKIDGHAHFLPKSVVEKSRLYGPVGEVAPFIYPHLHFDKVGAWIHNK